MEERVRELNSQIKSTDKSAGTIEKSFTSENYQVSFE